MLKEKNILNAIGIIGSLILFVIIAFIYASPVLHGDQLYQHDIVEYKGSAREPNFVAISSNELMIF